MPTLILTSQAGQVFTEVLEQLPQLKTARKVGYVWTAAKAEENYHDWAWIDADMFRAVGWDVEPVDIEGMDIENIKHVFDDRDFVYVQGGNTFFLLKCIRESGFDKFVSDAVATDKLIYMGCSAGSIVAGPSLETAEWLKIDPDRYGLEDLSALSLVNYAISPHVTLDKQKKLASLIKKAGYPVELLADDQFMLVENGVSHKISLA